MPCMKKGSKRGAWSSGDSGEGMLRYEEGLLVESISRRPEGLTVDHLGRRESLPNRPRLLFRGGGEGCMDVGRDVTGGS